MVPVVDAVATHDSTTGESAAFLVNRHQSEPATVTIDLDGLGGAKVVEALSLWDDDVTAVNTLAEPERVGMRTNDSVVASGSRVTITLPPVSWTAVRLA